MEDLYQQELAQLLGESARTDEVFTGMYEGEHAFDLMLSCMQRMAGGYRLHIKGLYHDTLMKILLILRDILPRENVETSRRSRLREELATLGLLHFSQYITSHKGDPPTYTLSLGPLSYEKARTVTRTLFSW